MSPRAATALLALAAGPPAYAGYVQAYQLISFAGFATRMGDTADEAAVLAPLGFVLAQVLGIAVGLFVAWQAAPRRRWGRAGLGLGLAWLASAPLFWALIRFS